ncbi:MAG: hypothetical protein LUF85_15710 [Bacteroides sp.]|nr:hypothetical protein [Bacteroides sp.]
MEVERRKENVYIDGFKAFLYLMKKGVKKDFDKNQALKEIQEMVDITNRQFVTRLKEAYPKLSTHDLQFASLLRLGVEKEGIAEIFVIDPHSIFRKKTRFSKKLGLNNAHELDEFIRKF